jgi:predicted GNAT superfamily acetyltransferase
VRVDVNVVVRTLDAADVDAVVAINNDELPAVTELDRDAAVDLLNMCAVALAAVDEVTGAILGFCLVLGPGQAYKSRNYRWVTERYERVMYLDRVCTSPQARRQGVGRALYAEAIARSTGIEPRPEWLVLEVNSRPFNAQSTAFHTALGFSAVGTAEPYGDGTEVTYYALEL